MDKPTPNEIPIKLSNAMDALIRAANAEDGYAVIGVVFSAHSIAVLRNTRDDPAQLLYSVADLVESKMREGRVVDKKVLPLN